MGKTRSQIVQSILNSYRPVQYIKKIKCGFGSHGDGSAILKVHFDIDKEKIEGEEVTKERLLHFAKELANKIKRETKMPIKYTQSTVSYVRG